MLSLIPTSLVLAVALAATNPPNALPPNLERVLDGANTAVIYSLDPNVDPKNGPQFHYFRVLGQSKLKATETKQAAHAFDDAITGWNNMMANCFNPRHALRIQSDGHVYDYLLCYECCQVEVFVDGFLKVDIGAAGSPDTLNRILRTHHLPVASADGQPR